MTIKVSNYGVRYVGVVPLRPDQLTPDYDTKGMLYEPRRIERVKSVAVDDPDANKLTWQGDDYTYAQILAAPDGGPSATLTLSQLDPDLVGMLYGYTADADAGTVPEATQLRGGGERPMLFFMVRAGLETGYDDNTPGARRWQWRGGLAYLYPKVDSAEFNTVNEIPIQVVFTPTKRGVFYQDFAYPVRQAYLEIGVANAFPRFLYGYGDGTTTTFSLPTDIADSLSGSYKVFLHDPSAGTTTKLTETTDFAVDTSAKTLTFTTAPADGNVIVFYYETKIIPPSD